MRDRAPALLAAFVLCLAGAAFGAPAEGLDPSVYSIRFENEKLRVLDAVYPPGKKTAMHAHPEHLLIVQEGSRLRVTEDGNVYAEREYQPNEVSWEKAGPHEVENIGSGTFKAYLIEIK